MTAGHVLLVGSAPVSAAEIQGYAAVADTIICADGGVDAVFAAGLLPDLALGDMDSISVAGRSRLAMMKTRVIEHPVDKDKTDIELALDEALLLEPHRITIAGALGGPRLDHTLGNIMLLALPALRGVDVRLTDHTGVAMAIWTSREIEGVAGDYVSLLPLTSVVDGVTTEGLKFPLYGERLVQGSTRGISNELVDCSARVSVDAGCLLLRHERRMPPGGAASR